MRSASTLPTCSKPDACWYGCSGGGNIVQGAPHAVRAAKCGGQQVQPQARLAGAALEPDGAPEPPQEQPPGSRRDPRRRRRAAQQAQQRQQP